MDRFPSSKPFALAFAMALITVFALNGAALADTYWSDTAPASVTDLLNAENWDNGAPTTAGNPGFITGKTITVSNDFYPGADGQDIDITFNGATTTTFSKGFVPLKNLPNGKTATFTMRLQDTANVYVTNNFWGGNNSYSQNYDQSGKDYLIYQYYSGNSTFSCNEWWTAMTAKTYIEISDNAVVTARGGSNSGLGWDNTDPYSADGSRIEMSGKGALNVSSTNLNFYGAGTTVNMRDSSSISAKALYVSRDNPQVNLYDNAKITTSDILKFDNKGSMTLNDNASLTVTKDCALDRNGRIDVNGNANVAFKAGLKIGDINAGDAGGAVFNLSGGTVTVSGTTYFSYHSDATVNISGGKFISNSNQLYATDQKGKTVDITMTNDGYLQAKDLRLSQHGNTNLTMSDTSQIKVENLNMAFNYASGDNVVNVVTMGGSSNITATSNMYFFGNNAAGAAYGSLTLNDNASVAIANEVQVGKGAATSLIDGKSYAAEITLNGNSKFSTTTFTTNSGATSATTVNGSATFEAETINLAANTFLNVNGGSVNVTSLNFEGTINLAGGAINLTPYGLITSTDGTFTGTGGTINVKGSDNVSYTTGDQLLVGLFANEATAAAVAGSTTAPEGWQTSVLQMGDSKAVVASYGNTAPTGVKTWIPGASGSMADSANWEGDFSNPTGYVLDGTNTMSNITGKTIVMGGENTFNGDMPAGTAFAFNDGTSFMKGSNYYGSIIVNEGTVDFTGGDRLLRDNAGYMEVNGGEVVMTSGWFKSYQDVVINGGKVSLNGNGLAMKLNSVTTNNGGEVIIKRLIVGDDAASNQNNPEAYTSKYVNNAGTTTISGLTEIAQKTNTVGYFDVNGGSVVTSDKFYVAEGATSKGYLNIIGDGSLKTKDLYLGYKGNAELVMSDNANLKVDGSTFHLAYNLASGDNVAANVTMSGNSRLETAQFRVFQGNNDKDHAGAGYASFTMTDNAYVYVSGNMWGGSNDSASGHVVGLLNDNSYNLEMTFSDNSYFSANEFWVGMTAKAHVIIEDNATVYARGGQSGIGWGANAAGSLVEIKGGTFKVDSNWFAIGCMNDSGTINTGVCNVVQTGGEATYKRILLGQNSSTYEISGVDSIMTSGDVTSFAGSSLNIKGGTANVGTITSAGNINVSSGTLNMDSENADGTIVMNGGTLNVAKDGETGGDGVINAKAITLTNNGVLNMSSGTINLADGGIASSDGAYTINLSGGTFGTNGASWSSALDAVIADGATVTFAPESGKEIEWAGNLTGETGTVNVAGEGKFTLVGAIDGSVYVESGAEFANIGSIGKTLTLDGDIKVDLDNLPEELLNVDGAIDGDGVIQFYASDMMDYSGKQIPFMTSASADLDTVASMFDFSQAGGDYYWMYGKSGDQFWVGVDSNAVPEPSTWALLVLGVAVWSATACRRFHNQRRCKTR
ncbi:MAG: PEP-CTERM sorting domain-containing protein [Thermoguttaceae bacterium]|nr:PEP-CTERM sorting domain-containing protein [Thermoguttaceae bacterium]